MCPCQEVIEHVLHDAEIDRQCENGNEGRKIIDGERFAVHQLL